MKDRKNKLRKTLFIGLILPLLLFSRGVNAQNKEIIGEWKIKKISFDGYVINAEDLNAQKKNNLSVIRNYTLKYQPDFAELVNNDYSCNSLLNSFFSQKYSFDGDNYIKSNEYIEKGIYSFKKGTLILREEKSKTEYTEDVTLENDNLIFVGSDKLIRYFTKK